MAELVSSSDVVDLVYEVAQDQMGRNKPFLESLSNVLKVAGDYQVIINSSLHFFVCILQISVFNISYFFLFQIWLLAHPTADLLQKVL